MSQRCNQWLYALLVLPTAMGALADDVTVTPHGPRPACANASHVPRAAATGSHLAAVDPNAAAPNPRDTGGNGTRPSAPQASVAEFTAAQTRHGGRQLSITDDPDAYDAWLHPALRL